MKLCGYRSGYCTSPGGCTLVTPNTGQKFTWEELGKMAWHCGYFVYRAAQNQLGLPLPRRRRDWKVGNPYERK